MNDIILLKKYRVAEMEGRDTVEKRMSTYIVENGCKKLLKSGVLLTILRIISLVVLVITSFVSIDLLINFLAALVPSMNDGIGAHTIISGVLYFGDNCYSLERFFDYFQTSSLISFVVFVENIVLSIIAITKKRK